MPATPITDPVTGESLLGADPQLLQQVDPAFWRQRLNLFTGRTLSVSALDSEQDYRGGLLATLGQAVTAGTVSGLALSMDTNGADPLLVVSPGYGITANGEDVVLNNTLKTHLSTLAVIDPVAGNPLYNFHQSVGDPTNTTYAGVLLLQPVVAQVSGQFMDTGTGPIEVSGNLGASCDPDPEEYAFEDWQIADAVRLVYLPWPAGVPSLTLPALAPEATLRNRLAYAIFEAEALLGPDDQLPWAMLGLPVALIAFDPGVAWAANTAFNEGQFITDPNSNLQLVQTAGTSGAAQPAKWNTTYGGTTTDGGVTWMNNGYAWKPLFVDCSAVVRAGGLPRRRYVLPAQPPPLLQWQSNTPFEADGFIIDANNNVQTVTTAGTTGGPSPQWKAVFGQTTTDGTVVWTNNGPASWQANNPFAIGQFVYDSNGNMQHVQVAGTSGTTEPDWNAIYLPTNDGSVIWINNGSGNPPVVQPALAQARINQLSEQLSQVMAQKQAFTTLADIFPTLPPSGILPAAALNFSNRTAAWLPPNWAVTAAPVLLEELETALEGGMTLDLLASETSAPEDNSLIEPVEVLVPLPDTVYDPDILVTEAVAQTFYQEVDQATEARNLTLQQMETVQQEVNTLFNAIGPNVSANPNLVDPNAGLTADELNSRNTSAPYTPASSETFGTLLESTWLPSAAYVAGQFVIDGNGMFQAVVTAGTSGSTTPAWNPNTAGTTSDGLTWLNSGKAAWQANTAFSPGQFIIDANGHIQAVQTGGISGSTAPSWSLTASTTDGGVTWQIVTNSPNNPTGWAASTNFSVGQAIFDSNGFIQSVEIGGVSGAEQPVWIQSFNATTTEATLTWLNNGPCTWQPNTAYLPGQFVAVSSQPLPSSNPPPALPPGPPQVFLQQVLAPGGVSASSPPTWNDTPGQNTQDGIIWQAGGKAIWQPDFLYAAGQLVLDTTGNIQIAQTGGISGDLPPAPWNPNPGQTTQDGGVTWTNLGHFTWQPSTLYATGQAVLDPAGNIQLAQTGGTSGANPPAWNEDASITTLDASVTWVNNGPMTWQSKSYSVGQTILDSNGNLQYSTVLDSNGNPQPPGTQGTTGIVQPTWNTTPGGTTADGAITWVYLTFYSTDLAQVKAAASQPPYTATFTDSTGNVQTITLLSAADLTNLENNGLQALITSLNARISQANDLLDTAFLTAQTDIYRFRQYVLGSTAATVLATSPILANIAAGESAAATTANLQGYINTILPPSTSTTTTISTGVSGAQPTTTTTTDAPAAPVFPPPVIRPVRTGVGGVTPGGLPTLFGPTRPPVFTEMVARAASTAAAKPLALRSQAITARLGTFKNVGVSRLPTAGSTPATGVKFTLFGGINEKPLQAALNEGLLQTVSQAGPAQVVGSQTPAVTSTDITNQSPLAGAQLNLRTLTIAQRLAQSPSQEAMFYSIGNRLNFLQTLEILENDLGLVADDLPILVDGDPTTITPAPPAGFVPVTPHYFSEWLNPNTQSTLSNLVNSPYLFADSDEAGFFSVGVRVVEQHSMLLRALEARVQQYVDFVSLCTTALNNIQSDIQQGQTYLSQLQNSLHQDRQNFAFTTALLSDETNRVNGVNAQRQQVLQSSVQLVAYTRARTLQATDTAPSRQLNPANVASPVPACLQQSVSIPPELREIVGQLREAPVNWLPAIATQMNNLQRPVLLQQLGMSLQARAAQQLQMAILPSSAAGESGVYASTISAVYSANQQVFREYQVQRAAFRPANLVNYSWSVQVANLQNIAAVNDLISADSVHTEISNVVARLIQQISSVATCLYTRVSIALPIDRLAWATYLSGPGVSVQLQSLAVLPSWNQLAYTDRQQMQMLVDWLFQQIDTTNPAATAFMSDVVRTAILLASDVPVDSITPGNVIARTQPVVGGVVSLNLPSDRIASGMYVNLYSGANLAARAVVSDLDTTTVRATVTDVFAPGTYLETSDTAHFTAQTPQALALRPFFARL